MREWTPLRSNRLLPEASQMNHIDEWPVVHVSMRYHTAPEFASTVVIVALAVGAGFRACTQATAVVRVRNYCASRSSGISPRYLVLRSTPVAAVFQSGAWSSQSATF